MSETQIWVSCHIHRTLCFITWDDCLAVNETASPTPLHDKPRAGLLNRSKGRGALIRRTNPRGRRGGNGNVHGLRVWSHMREIKESRQQIRFSHHLVFNFAELGCRSSQVGSSSLRSGGCDCCPLFSWEKVLVASCSRKQPNGFIFSFNFSLQTSTQTMVSGLPQRFFCEDDSKKIKNK